MSVGLVKEPLVEGSLTTHVIVIKVSNQTSNKMHYRKYLDCVTAVNFSLLSHLIIPKSVCCLKKAEYPLEYHLD